MNRVIVAFLILASCNTQAQQNFADSSLLSQVHNTRRVYDKERGDQLAIYNGTQFFPYSNSIEGIAFFKDDVWRKGNVIFSDILYEDIYMRYDLVTDQLIVTPNFDGGLFIALYSPRVSEFSYGGNKFVRLTREMTDRSLPEGFYQELVKGNATVYVRSQKEIKEKIDVLEMKRWYESRTRYYMLKDGKYNPIRSKNDLTNLLKEHRKEVNQALNRLNQRYRQNVEQYIIVATGAYNQSN